MSGQNNSMKYGAVFSGKNKAKIQAAYDALGELLGVDNEPDPADPDEGAESEAKSAPAVTLPEKVLSFSYVKSLRLPHNEQYFKDVLAAKFTAPDTVRMYSMLWGDPGNTDLEQDFFTKSTDFWDKSLGLPKPLTYDHGQDDATKNETRIGDILNFGDDEIGRWCEAQLYRNHLYRKAVDRLVSMRALGASSDSAPQYVIREPVGKSANFLKQWPWFATALTTTPCEPRMLDIGSPHWKSLGVNELSLPGRAAVDAATIESLKRQEESLARFGTF